MTKKRPFPLNYLIYKSRALNFAFRKHQFDAIYNAYSNELPFKYQRCILCRKLERNFPVGLGTSSRILRGSPAVFVLSRNFAVNCAFFGLFWVNFADFQHFWVDFGHFWANFEHFLTAFISRFLVNGSYSQ